MNKELWEKAIEFHGHKCLGVALGFRMGEEAKKIFGNNAEIHCKMPSRNCATDGITVTPGASVENGRIQIDSSVRNCIFYLPDDEEGWMFIRKEINFPSEEDAYAAVLEAGRDFLFTIMPVDM